MTFGSIATSRWVLVAMLLFGVATMHHVTPGDPAAGHGGQHGACCGVPAGHGQTGDGPAPAPSWPRNVLHLCLAVLTVTAAVTAVALALLAAAMAYATLPRPPSWNVRPVHRRPARPPTAVRLALVGVLRI